MLTYLPEEQVAATDEDGMTALMIAAEEGHAECAHVLLAHVPEDQVKAANKHGMLALMTAAWHGHTRCLEVLQSHVVICIIICMDIDIQI